MTIIKKPSGMYYGWWVLGACFLIGLYTGGVIFFGFTAFLEPISEEFGWSYAMISLAASIRGLEAGILSPVTGALVDRWGPRKLLLIGSIITGSGLVLLSLVNSLSMFYLTFILIAVGISGSNPSVILPTIANWFRKKLSIATGIVVSGFALGGILVPVVVKLIDTQGWRTAIVGLGIGIFIICLPLALVVHRNPEQYGYLPDGEKIITYDHKMNPEQVKSAQKTLKLIDVLRSRTFWHIAVASIFYGAISMAVITHIMPYLSSIGVSRSTASFLASAVPLISIGGRLSFGWLGDKFRRVTLLAISFALLALGLLFFNYLDNDKLWLTIAFLIFFSIGYGSSVTLRLVVTREYFNRSNFGTIFGFVMGLTVLGQVVGPPLAGWVFDNWGSYQGIWLVFAVIAILALFIILTIPPLGKRIKTVEKVV